MVGTKNLSILKRAKIHFINQQICTEKNPTNFIFTAFEGTDFTKQVRDDLLISNVFYKPFDMLILKQQLEFALNGRKPLVPKTITPLIISENIEMLKSHKVTQVSEFGFQVKSKVDLGFDTVGKFYGDYYASESKASAIAICTSSVQNDSKEFVCDFNFVGLDSRQIAQLRRNIFADKKYAEGN